MKILLQCLLLLACTGCSNNQKTNGGNSDVAGGACRYEVKKLKATVLAVVKKEAGSSDILFRVTDNGQIYRDSLSWYMQEHRWVPDSLLAGHQIEPGTACDYEVHTLVQGSCDGRLEFLTLNRYNPTGQASR